MVDIGKTMEQPGKEMEQTLQKVDEFKNYESMLMWAKETTEKDGFSLSAVLESLPYPFYVIDVSDYTIRVANSAAQFESLTKDSTCYALTHKSERPCGSGGHPCPIEEIKNNRRPMTVEHLHHDKDGNLRNVEVHAFAVFDNEGNVSQIVEYVLDITQRKQAEDRLDNRFEIGSHWKESLIGIGETFIYQVIGMKEN